MPDLIALSNVEVRGRKDDESSHRPDQCARLSTVPHENHEDNVMMGIEFATALDGMERITLAQATGTRLVS